MINKRAIMLNSVLTEEFLIEEYVNKQRSIRSISLELRCGNSFIRKKLKEYNIQIRRKKRDNHDCAENSIEFGSRQDIRRYHQAGNKRVEKVQAAAYPRGDGEEGNGTWCGLKWETLVSFKRGSSSHY